jgi:hypothetical protein
MEPRDASPCVAGRIDSALNGAERCVAVRRWSN